jgi:hypothetical protein
MRRSIWRYWLALALVAGLCGCERATVKHDYPPDPLLLSRRPLESKPETATVDMVYNEPAAPTLPTTALASAPKSRVGALRNSVAQESDAEAAPPAGRPVVAQPVSNSFQRLNPTPQDTDTRRVAAGPPTAGGTVSAVAQNPTTNPVPAIRAQATAETGGVPGGQGRAPGTYGHAPDYSWLQGVLGKHYHGHWDLRYCDHTVEDNWGGKVRLGKDARLDQFKEGDVIRVEGEVVRDHQGHGWQHYPEYRIRNIQLIEHGGR